MCLLNKDYKLTQYNELSSVEPHEPGSENCQLIQQMTSSLSMLHAVSQLHDMLIIHTVEIQMPSCGSCASVIARQSVFLYNLPNSSDKIIIMPTRCWAY